MSPDYYLRPAGPDDADLLSGILANENCLQHRHLDWHLPVDWLGAQPFWILGKQNTAVAALSCPDDPPGIYWVRLFASLSSLRLLQTWKLLFEKAYATIPQSPQPVISTLAVQKWYLDMVSQNGFSHHTDIVVLEWKKKTTIEPQSSGGFTIRPMAFNDLQTVQEIDDAAFQDIWKNSLSITRRAYQSSDYATVAELNGKIVGFQISSSTPLNAHLARIAVVDGLRRKGIGSAIIQDLISHFVKNRIGIITVNTQRDNLASLALYHKSGFELNGEKFPVLTYTCP